MARINDNGFVYDGDSATVNEMLTGDASEIVYNHNSVFVPANFGGAEVQIGKDSLRAMVEAAPDDWFEAGLENEI